jgi:hypothetical protein
VTEQLSFELYDGHTAPGTGNGHGEHDPADRILERLRVLVAEDGMSEDEIQAAVEDALAQLGLRENTGIPVQCRCTRPLVFRPDIFDAVRCAYCGRAP